MCDSDTAIRLSASSFAEKDHATLQKEKNYHVIMAMDTRFVEFEDASEQRRRNHRDKLRNLELPPKLPEYDRIQFASLKCSEAKVKYFHRLGDLEGTLGLSTECETLLNETIEQDFKKLKAQISTAKVLSMAAEATSVLGPISYGFSKLLGKALKRVQRQLFNLVENVKTLIQEGAIEASLGLLRIGLDQASLLAGYRRNGVYCYEALEIRVVIDAQPVVLGLMEGALPPLAECEDTVLPISFEADANQVPVMVAEPFQEYAISAT